MQKLLAALFVLMFALSISAESVNNPVMKDYSLKKGVLTLTPSTPTIEKEGETCTFVSRRLEHFNFSSDVNVELKNATNGDDGGITIYMGGNAH